MKNAGLLPIYIDPRSKLSSGEIDPWRIQTIGAIGIYGDDHYKVGRFWRQVDEVDVIAMSNVIGPATDIGPVDLNDIAGGPRRGCPGNTCGRRARCAGQPASSVR